MFDYGLWSRPVGAEVEKNGQAQLEKDFVRHAKQFVPYLENNGNTSKVVRRRIT